MFRAIDPDRLVEVANLLARWGDRIRHEALLANAVLARRVGVDFVGVDLVGVDLVAVDVAGVLIPIERWATETATDLRWRADTIRLGQSGSPNPPALLHAEFAATGIFGPGAQETAFVTWLRNRDASRQTVAGAVAGISSWLSQGWLDWDVTNRDLHSIKTMLESLTSSELDQVIAALSPRQLERWIAEMGHSFNGFSRAEKQVVFELLAENSSGDSLRRVHNALLASGGRTDLLDFGDAIQLHSPDAVIADFVAGVLAGHLADRRFSLLAPGRAVEGLQHHDATQKTAGVILEHGSALPWLIADCLVAGEDPAPFIAALARTTNSDRMAAGFVDALALLAAPGELRRIIAARHSGTGAAGRRQPRPLLEETQEHLLSASIQFLTAAPEEAFTHLATIADPGGDLTCAFWSHLVSRGDTASIAATLEGLRGGPGVDLDRFTSRGTDPDYEYPYARNLAFAAATLNRGLTQSAQEAQGDIDAIGRIAGVATAVAGLYSGASGVVEFATGAGADWSIETYATKVKTNIDDQLADLIDAVTTQLRPPDGVDLNPFPHAGNALLAWTSVYIELLPSA